MKLSVIKLTAFASLAAVSVAQFNTACNNGGSDEFTSLANCESVIDTKTIPACANAVTTSEGDPCNCAAYWATYACATSVCGPSIQSAWWYGTPDPQCGTAPAAASYATTTSPSGTTVDNTEGQSAAATSMVQVSTTAAVTSNPTASVASQTSSAEAGVVRGPKEAVVAVLVGIAGALI